MNAIIMAAGIGSRLAPLHLNRPKCLLEADGETLVRRLVRQCHEQGIDDVSVVVGYRAELVERELGDSVRFLHNEFYEQTNSLMSLWMAREQLTGDALVMNADLFFEPLLLRTAIEQTLPAVMLADSSRVETADYGFGLEASRIVRHGKAHSLAQTDAEYVGLARIDAQFMPRFRSRLDELFHAGRVHDWWEQTLYSYIPEGVPIYAHDVAGLMWTEVDCLRDYERLRGWVPETALARAA